MRDWFFRSVLRDTFREGDDGTSGGDDEVEVDPGESFEHEIDEPAKPAAAATKVKDDADEEVGRLKEENARLSRENAESKRDVEFWSSQTRRAQSDKDTRGAADAQEDDEVEELPDVKPEDLINDLAKEGLGALKKHGMLTRVDLDKAIRQVRGETQQVVNTARSDAEFGIRLRDEFPDIATESEKLRTDPSYRTTSPLFLKTAAIYRGMIAEDPTLDGKQSTFMLCARQARAELRADGKLPDSGKDGKTVVDKGRQRTERRERIEQQAAPRSNARGRESAGDGGTDLSSTQSQVIKNLSRFGVTEENFSKQAERGRRR